MNEQSPALPELSDDAVARIEHAVFDRIADEPARSAPASSLAVRRRRWLTGTGIAAAFVAGILITPPILGAVTGSGSDTSADGGSVGVTSEEAGTAPDMGVPEGADQGSSLADDGAVPGDGATSVEEDGDREIIATAQARVEVDDVAAAVDAIGDLAEEHGGYVESTNVSDATAEETTGDVAVQTTGYGWISIRVPSADLTAVIDALADTGDVLSSSTSQQDVTSTAIDLRARVDALEASVARLTELMSQSGSVSELIEAEGALTERQAELESYQEQLASLEDQVAMSSLQVELVRQTTATTADPAGFGDGLLAGWNGLVVSLNALVIALGFLLPWIAVAAVVFLIVWGVRGLRRRRRIQE